MTFGGYDRSCYDGKRSYISKMLKINLPANTLESILLIYELGSKQKQWFIVKHDLIYLSMLTVVILYQLGEMFKWNLGITLHVSFN